MSTPDERAFMLEGFSQEGEDLLLWRLLQNQAHGFYVDVGAHHPHRFSNTHFFYKRGWRGINIEADPAAHALFVQHRPEDINISCLVSDTPAIYAFDIYNEPALNSAVAARRDNLGGNYHVTQTLTLQARTLAAILSDAPPPATGIDFLSVDVEGFDLKVLASNDWARHRPRYVVVEAYIDLAARHADPVQDFLAQQGYALRSFLYLSAVYERRDATA